MGSAIHDNSRGAEVIRGDEFGWYGTEESRYVMSAKVAVGEVLQISWLISPRSGTK